MERSHAAARSKGIEVRALVVINPGTPTGNVLTREDMEGVVHFAAKHGLVLIADEVYQTNVWDTTKQFTSFKRVAAEAGLVDPVGDPYRGGLQLASMHSTSKGFVGECGRRGGYLELCGFSEEVRGELYKLASLQLCSNTTGQVMTGLQCQPPRPGDPSHALYTAERDAILASLARRAAKLNAAVNTMEGASCQPAEGAMYAFPQISLPPKALAAAAAAGGGRLTSFTAWSSWTPRALWWCPARALDSARAPSTSDPPSSPLRRTWTRSLKNYSTSTRPSWTSTGKWGGKGRAGPEGGHCTVAFIFFLFTPAMVAHPHLLWQG